MRTYGRVNGQWTEVSTDAQGFNDGVYLTSLGQVLLLNRGESPFFANYGIPAQQSVVQQVFPDFYVSLTQQQYSSFFASLIVAKLDGTTPAYRVNATTQAGYRLNFNVPIPV